MQLLCCQACPHCGPCEEGEVHDCPPRTNRLLVDGYAKIFRSRSWRCIPCGKRFTELSLFALPYKRFVIEDLCDRCRAFPNSDQSYRDAVKLQGRELVRDDRPDEALARQDAALTYSTVGRWLSWLGDGLLESIRIVRQWFHARAPRNTPHRELCCEAPYKYCSTRGG